jgi:hypothetical protein
MQFALLFLYCAIIAQTVIMVAVLPWPLTLLVLGLESYFLSPAPARTEKR